MMRDLLFTPFEYFKDSVTDVPVVNVFTFVLLEPSDDESREREQDDLIDRIQDKLQQKLVHQLLSGQYTPKCDGKEDKGIRRLSGDGTQDKPSGESSLRS